MNLEEVTVDAIENMAHIPRRCDLCYYRDFYREDLEEYDCCIRTMKDRLSPKQKLGLPEDALMPQKIDDKEVAEDCEYFLYFDE